MRSWVSQPRFLCFITIFLRRNSNNFSEKPGEIITIIYSDFIRYLVNLHISCFQHFACLVYLKLIEIIQRTMSRTTLEDSRNL